jgi:hypothetical protein
MTATEIIEQIKHLPASERALVKKYVVEENVSLDTADLETEFNALVAKWREDTFPYSSLTKQFNHPAYVRIMAMGKQGIPLVLREMQRSQDSWFYALKFMAGEDASEGIKDFDAARTAWTEWGYKHNYL